MTKDTEPIKLKNAIVEAILDRKGKEVVVLDMSELEQSIAEYFVICHGDSNVQVDAISESIDRHVKTELHESPLQKEGKNNSQWILVDYGDVVVHIFLKEYRDFYKLEELWADAKVERIEDE